MCYTGGQVHGLYMSMLLDLKIFLIFIHEVVSSQKQAFKHKYSNWIFAEKVYLTKGN